MCYPNGSYFWDNTVNDGNRIGEILSCVLPNTNLTTGQWVRVADPLDPVDCNSNSDHDPFRCSLPTFWSMAISRSRGILQVLPTN